MICKFCGKEIGAGARFCQNCGAAVSVQQDMPCGGVQSNVPRQESQEKKADPDNPDALPKEDLVPLTTSQCVWIIAAMLVPVLNLILMLKWAYAERGNESRRSFARAGLILMGSLIGIIVVVLAGILVGLNMGWITVPHLL